MPHSLLPEPSTHQPQVGSFDFNGQRRVSKTHLQAIHLLHEAFARNAGASASMYLHTTIRMNLTAIAPEPYSEFVAATKPHGWSAIISLAPLDGRALIELDSMLIFAVLEARLGGRGAPLLMQRRLTDIEKILVTEFASSMLQDLKEAWRSIHTVEPEMSAIDGDTQRQQLHPSNDIMIAISMEMHIGEVHGTVRLAMPLRMFRVLETVETPMDSVQTGGASTKRQQRMLDLLQLAQCVGEARLLGPTVRIGDLIRLKEGDILGLDYSVEEPLQLVWNEKMKYSGHVIRAGKKRAFAIQEPLA